MMKAIELPRFEQDMDGSMEPKEFGQWVYADDAEVAIDRLSEIVDGLVVALKRIDAAAGEIPEELEGYMESLSLALAEARDFMAETKEIQPE